MYEGYQVVGFHLGMLSKEKIESLRGRYAGEKVEHIYPGHKILVLRPDFFY